MLVSQAVRRVNFGKPVGTRLSTLNVRTQTQKGVDVSRVILVYGTVFMGALADEVSKFSGWALRMIECREMNDHVSA
jgi:hypothetical protein